MREIKIALPIAAVVAGFAFAYTWAATGMAAPLNGLLFAALAVYPAVQATRWARRGARRVGEFADFGEAAIIAFGLVMMMGAYVFRAWVDRLAATMPSLENVQTLADVFVWVAVYGGGAVLGLFIASLVIRWLGEREGASKDALVDAALEVYRGER